MVGEKMKKLFWWEGKPNEGEMERHKERTYEDVYKRQMKIWKKAALEPDRLTPEERKRLTWCVIKLDEE
jgi:hypothetical protein